MANTHTEEERKIYIDLVGDYFLNYDNPSLRKCAKYLKEVKGIILSLPTIKSYLHTFVRKNPIKGKKILNIIEKNTPDKIEDEEVKERVKKVAQMFISGNSVYEISKDLNISINTIYRDLNERLKKIDVDLYNKVKPLLNEHSLSNLNTGNNSYETQERDINGRFKK